MILPAFGYFTYILRRKEEIIYVGMTENLFGRLGTHALFPLRFDEVEVQEHSSRSEALQHEMHLIVQYDPPYNTLGTSRHVTSPGCGGIGPVTTRWNDPKQHARASSTMRRRHQDPDAHERMVGPMHASPKLQAYYDRNRR